MEIIHNDKRILELAGLIPNTKFTTRIIITCAITWFLAVGIFFPMIMELILNARSVEQVAQILYYFVTQLSYLCKMINFMINKDIILNLEVILENPLTHVKDQSGRAMLEEAKKSLHIMAILYRGATFAVILFFGLFSVLDSESESPLIVPGWFYVDVNEYATQVVTYQLVSILVSANFNSTMDIFTYRLIKLGSVQFEILQNNLSDLLSLSSKDVSTKEEDYAVIKYLKTAIVRHDMLLE